MASGAEPQKGNQVREDALPADLALLLSAFRVETQAQISSLKAWGIAMCLGGGTLGGIVASFTHPAAARAAIGVLPFL